jgi:hypothetical protein
MIAGMRHGQFVLWLGPTGCTAVGAGIMVACLYSAWKRLAPRPMEHLWKV